jgi:leucyl/phenylalanyl-tRNA--protein transferase
MPYYFLGEELIFPSLENTDEHGILALGGDLSSERLLLAYRSGIFPWYSADEPIIWWSPDPRFALYPSNIKVSKSMRQVLRKGQFEVTLDQNFAEVIYHCGKIKRRGQYDTWITEEMKQAYIHLHQLGYAHSVEVWENGSLVGGLYGVSLGRCFFGESMFSYVSNASKAGFITIVQHLIEREFMLVDCQVHTKHLESLGAEHISRDKFVENIKLATTYPSIVGSWQDWIKK